MGKILVIDDDRNIQALIEKIVPKEDMRVIRTLSPKTDGPAKVHGPVMNRSFPASAEDKVRAFLREEVTKSSLGGIYNRVIGRIEKMLIGMILEEEKGNQVRASRRLGINRNTLRKKMKDLQITTRVVAGEEES